MTPQQARALGFIKTFIAENGYSPSYAEIAAFLGLKSKGNVARIVKVLVAQGAIVLHLGHRRATRIPAQGGSGLAACPEWARIREALDRIGSDCEMSFDDMDRDLRAVRRDFAALERERGHQ